MLGCLISARGIEANPEKIDVILNMEPPTSRKLAQRLAGRLAALNRFISRSVERGLPFFDVLKTQIHIARDPNNKRPLRI